MKIRQIVDLHFFPLASLKVDKLWIIKGTGGTRGDEGGRGRKFSQSNNTTNTVGFKERTSKNTFPLDQL